MRILAAVVLLGSCDPRAGSAVAAGGPAARPSRAGETCSATGDCEEPLRCVAAVCAPGEGSRLGELYWAVAAGAAERGQPPAELYQQAMTAYEAEKKTAPPGLLCDYGAALRRRPGDAKAGEQAARLLHRCLLATPHGSAEHARALRELAELVPRGLDPQLVARDSPADTYLVNPVAKAPTENLRVEVGRTAKATDRGYEAFAKRLEAADARAPLVKCFADYWTATHKPRLAVALGAKLAAKLNDDDEYAGGTLELQPDPAASGPEAAAADCLRAGLAPLAADFAKAGSSGSWSGGYTLTMAVPE